MVENKILIYTYSKLMHSKKANAKRTTLRHISQNVERQRESLESSKKKRLITYKGTPTELRADLAVSAKTFIVP